MTSQELDLHGHTWNEAKNAFFHLYNDNFDANGQPLVTTIDIIHGYGSTGEGGTIRTRLRRFLDRQKDCLEFLPGEDVDGNQGHTLVAPSKPLPKDEDVLLEDIVDYCERPRTPEKIAGEFARRADSLTIKQAMNKLQREGRLKKVVKNHRTMYEAGRADG